MAASAQPSDPSTANGGPFQFTPLPTSAPCTEGGNVRQPFLLPPGYGQRVFAEEGDGGTADLWDMNTLNEDGPEAGKLLYRTHEVRNNGQVSVTEVPPGVNVPEPGSPTRVLATRPDWERFDGIAWSPNHTIFAAEEVITQAFPDPAVPQARGGLTYEIDPATGAHRPLPAVGARSHEGLRFDPEGNLYGISERAPGFIYRFVPDKRGDYSSGQLYALKIVEPQGDRTGEAIWTPLDRTSVQVDSDAAAAAAEATSYARPEDFEIATSSGNNRGRSGSNTLYVAVTSENRVLKIDLREPRGNAEHLTARVSEFVRKGVNAPADFDAPDNLALDKNGNLFITEDPGGGTGTKTAGDDIWAAATGPAGNDAAESVVRFASLTDCEAEPTGIYFDKSGQKLYVNAQHRGGDGRDLGVVITDAERLDDRPQP